MLVSMTGYGKAECDLPKMIYSIEIKSLNSKQLDISMKLPILLKERELEIRNLISQELQRGKVDFGIFQDVVPLLEKEPLEGRLWIVEEERVRIRP